jgi:hypothetical protein
MIVYLNFNGKTYTLNLTNIDEWTRQASISASDMQAFIKEVIKNNPNILTD